MAAEDTVLPLTTSTGENSESPSLISSMPPATATSDPHQPRTFAFPKRSFGKKTVVWRAFQAKWFDSYSWLHYDEANDIMFCHLCKQAATEKKLMASKCADEAFTSRGFSNWKDATASFARHEQSKCHKEATHAIVTVPSCYKDCAEMLSSQHAKEKADSRHMLLKILSNVRFLARQGLPLRGSSQGDDSNFIQLLKLRGTDDVRLAEWIQRKSSKYTTADMQNEMLVVMSLRVLREIASAIRKALFFTVMVDEEQVVIVIRWVDEDLIVHESFIGLYSVPAINADMLTTIIKDSLVRMNLSMNKIRGQCYEGHPIWPA